LGGEGAGYNLLFNKPSNFRKMFMKVINKKELRGGDQCIEVKGREVNCG
jgi:hypothetical protein